MMLIEGYKHAVELYNQISNTLNGRRIISFFAEHGASKWDLEWFANCSAKDGIKPYILITDYRDWKKYVIPYYKKNEKQCPNLNQLTYMQTIQIINSCKRYFAKPNPVYNKNGIYIGTFNSFQDAQMLPISTTWCITKTPKRYDEFCSNGKQGLYIINNNNAQPYRNVIAIIDKGNVEYWDSTNRRMSELDDEIERFNQYEQTLPDDAKQIIYNYAANQTEQIENNKDINENINMKSNKKQVIRLTESDLHRVIKESVKKILNEQNEYTVDNPYEIYLPNRGETYYVWETLGDFYGSSDIESQRGNITNARKKQIFRASQGFETIDDVEQYVLKYFDR